MHTQPVLKCQENLRKPYTELPKVHHVKHPIEKNNYYKSLFICLKLQRLSLVFPQVLLVIKGEKKSKSLHFSTIILFHLSGYFIYSLFLYFYNHISAKKHLHPIVLFFKNILNISSHFFIFYNIHFHLIFQGFSK